MNGVPAETWSWTELDRFESDVQVDSTTDLVPYLPPAGHPEFLDALTELARLDMELAHGRNERRTPDYYFSRFPQLAADPVATAGVVHGYNQLHPEAGSRPCRSDIRNSESSRGVGSEFRRADHGLNRDSHPESTALLAHPSPDSSLSISVCESTSQSTALPNVGDTVVGFQLIDELGQGAFGRVYLARQGDLAARPVAVKIGTGLISESHTLARLQHTNIVPIYSAHKYGPFQLVCMPFLGRVTLAQLILKLRVDGLVVPESARHLIETLHPGNQSTRPIRASGDYSSTPADVSISPTIDRPPLAEPVPTPQLTPRGGIWDRLIRDPFPEAAVWIVAQLAAGLVHAHERGITHRDLKPANVLLTDDGVPMLLDFNLADDTNARNGLTTATVGGTLPYMAPEQLTAFSGQPSRMDARTDLYSLGVVLYELLAGNRPFPERNRVGSPSVPAMLTDRTGSLPPIRKSNPFVRPSLESLVGKLLDPEPSRRYQSAADLVEDLNRYLERRPLRHATNPSWRERVKNWAVRHPRLVSSGSVGGIFGVIAVTILGTALVAREHTRTLEARLALDEHTRDLRGLQTLLDDRGLSRARLNDALNQCEGNLARYGLRADSNRSPDEWDGQVLVRYLPTEDRVRLREQIGELYFLMGRAAFQRAKMTDVPAERSDAVREAERWNKQAEEFGGTGLARAVIEQRIDLYRMAGKRKDADRLADDASHVKPGSPRDRFLLGFWWYQRGYLRRALPELTAATAADPQNFSAWFVLGATHLGVEQPDLAAMCFTACIALRSDFAPARLNRGLALMRLGKPKPAIEDFDVAVRLDPKRAEPHFLRAGALAQLGQHRDAERGYTEALACPDCPPRVYLYRAASRTALKDGPGAEADRAEADRREPTDALGWVARAENVSDSEPQVALKYVNQALSLSPFEVSAFQLKAHLLSEKLNRPEESIRVLDRALEHYPEHVPCLAGRAVMKARAKDREGAVADAKAALLLDSRGPNLYQIACVYALTSRVQPDDRFKAIELLHAALRSGFGREHLPDDPDLDPIRGSEEFQALLKGKRAD